MRFFILVALLLLPWRAVADPIVSAPSTALMDDEVTARVSGLDPAIGYWVTLIPQTAQEGTWDKYIYIENATEAEVSFVAPGTGAYEFRLHDKQEPYALYARSPIMLTAQIYGPPEFEVSGDFSGPGKTIVGITGLNPHIRYWVTLIAASEPLGNWAQYHYMGRQTEAEFAFDPVPGGTYQLRLHDRAEGDALYLSAEFVVSGPTAAEIANADSGPEYTGPCPQISNTDSASVAACLRHLGESSVAYVFKNTTSSCGNMQFQLSLAQENKEGTYQNLRAANLEKFEQIDCKMIARQVSEVFGQTPGWAGCVDHPRDVGPAEHIACVESTPVVGPRRNARSAANVDIGVRAAFPVTCEELHGRLWQSYAKVFHELNDWQAFLAVFPRDMSCAPYQTYLEGNVARRADARRTLADQRAAEQQQALEQRQAQRAILDAIDSSFDQMHRESVAARADDIHSPAVIDPRNLQWALVKILHRLEPERQDQLTTLLHTSNGLRQRSGRGRSQIISTHSVADLRLRSCGPIADAATTCEIEVSMVTAMHAPNDQGGASIIALFGGPIRQTSTLSIDVAYVDAQWELANLTPATLDALWKTADAPQGNGGYQFGGYSPEDCLWLQSMGAGRIC